MTGKARQIICLDTGRQFFDSLIYDSKGRLIRTRHNRIWRFPLTIFTYDTNNFIQRLYHDSDHKSNVRIDYELQGDTIFRKTSYSNSIDFPPHDSSYSPSKRSNDFYYLLKGGKIIKSVSNSNSETDYVYDSLSRVIEINKKWDNTSEKTRYSYLNDGNKLLSQVQMRNGDTISVKWYENGVLSSAEEDINGDDVLDSIKYTIKEVD